MATGYFCPYLLNKNKNKLISLILVFDYFYIYFWVSGTVTTEINIKIQIRGAVRSYFTNQDILVELRDVMDFKLTRVAICIGFEEFYSFIVWILLISITQ